MIKLKGKINVDFYKNHGIMNSLVESFVEMYNGNVHNMKSALEASDLMKEDILDSTVYTFSDDSYIMFNKSDKNLYITKAGIYHG